MYSEGLKFLEKAQLYLAIGLIILGHLYEIKSLVITGAGIFIGLSVSFYMMWKKYLSARESCQKYQGF